jgi:transposase IS4-like protein
MKQNPRSPIYTGLWTPPKKPPGALPARFMVYFTLALALFQQDSYDDDVAEHMVGGVPELGESIPDKSSFTRARQRLGAQAIETVFRRKLTLVACVWRGNSRSRLCGLVVLVDHAAG